jgi:hypothetical protein
VSQPPPPKWRDCRTQPGLQYRQGGASSIMYCLTSVLTDVHTYLTIHIGMYIQIHTDVQTDRHLPGPNMDDNHDIVSCVLSRLVSFRRFVASSFRRLVSSMPALPSPSWQGPASAPRR